MARQVEVEIASRKGAAPSGGSPCLSGMLTPQRHQEGAADMLIARAAGNAMACHVHDRVGAHRAHGYVGCEAASASHITLAALCATAAHPTSTMRGGHTKRGHNSCRGSLPPLLRR